MSQMKEYKEIEESFSLLISALDTVFVKNELAEVQHYLDHGEYGLALEAVVDIFIEEQKTATLEVMEIIKYLAESMSISSDPLLSKVRVENSETK
jgi:hypothetical protein